MQPDRGDIRSMAVDDNFRHRFGLYSFFLRSCMALVLAAALLSSHAFANDSSHVDTGRLYLVCGTALSAGVLIHIYQHNAWWQGQQEPFRFENDWEYALNVDKFGHAYGAYSESRLARAVLLWTGFNDDAALFYGSVFGFTYQTYVEVEDGYHRSYGFSPGDAIANTIGSSLPLLQRSFPVLSNFSLKYSYFPSRQYLNDLKSENFRVFIDDYEGSVFWITMDPHFLMSPSAAKALPAWLGLALGIGGHNLEQPTPGVRNYYLTTDVQFSRIKAGGEFLSALFGALDFFHFPAPGLAIENRKLKVGIFYTYNVKVTL